MPITQTFKYAADLDIGACRATLRQPLATLDANAHTFAVTVAQDGAPADLSDTACEGWFVRADGVTIPLDGEISGITASVTLAPACYAVPGRFELAMKLTRGTLIHTILRADGSVTVSRTDALAPSGDAVQSFDQLAQAIEGIHSRDRVASLLINGDWRNPVNQRGASGGNYNGGYIIDRWLAYGEGFELKAKGIAIPPKGRMEQRLEKGTISTSKVYTVGAMTSGNTLHVGETGRVVCTILTKYTDYDEVTIQNDSTTSVTIAWVALYEGEYNGQTFPQHMPRGYAAELHECMRYYIRMPSNAQLTFGGYGYSATAARFTIPVGVTMRATPELRLDDISACSILPGSIVPTSIGGRAVVGPMVTFGVTAPSGVTANVPAVFRPGTVVELDAEL